MLQSSRSEQFSFRINKINANTRGKYSRITFNRFQTMFTNRKDMEIKRIHRVSTNGQELPKIDKDSVWLIFHKVFWIIYEFDDLFLNMDRFAIKLIVTIISTV